MTEEEYRALMARRLTPPGLGPGVVRLTGPHGVVLEMPVQSPKLADVAKRPYKPRPPITGYGCTFDSKTELEYAGMLEARRLAGEIASWRHEAITLRLGPELRYWPDFLVIPLGAAKPELHEVKGGFTREDARAKLRSAPTIFPMFAFVLAVRGKRGVWRTEWLSS